MENGMDMSHVVPSSMKHSKGEKHRAFDTETCHLSLNPISQGRGESGPSVKAVEVKKMDGTPLLVDLLWGGGSRYNSGFLGRILILHAFVINPKYCFVSKTMLITGLFRHH